MVLVAFTSIQHRHRHDTRIALLMWRLDPPTTIVTDDHDDLVHVRYVPPTVLLTLPLGVPSQPLATNVASRRVAQKICIHALQ
jgi:hypothetical protein